MNKILRYHTQIVLRACVIKVCSNGGDFNVDFSRNTGNVRYLRDFLESQTFLHVWDNENAKVSSTYESYDGLSSSVIDHFFVTSNLYQYVSDAYVINDPDNVSNHNVIISEFLTGFSEPCVNFNVKNYTNLNSVSWNRASDDNLCRYSKYADKLLSKVELPVSDLYCKDSLCKCTTHIQDLNTLCNNICKTLLEASSKFIPKILPNKKHKPCWGGTVKSERDSAIMWHAIWCSAGRPQTGVLANIRRSTRAQYHRAIRNAYKKDQEMHMKQMAMKIYRDKERNMWDEIKRLKPKRRNITTCIDGISDSSGIANMFKNNYETLYNCQSATKCEMDEFKELLDKSVWLCGHSDTNCIVTVQTIITATKDLRKNKSDGSIGLSSNHLLHGPQRALII